MKCRQRAGEAAESRGPTFVRKPPEAGDGHGSCLSHTGLGGGSPADAQPPDSKRACFSCLRASVYCALLWQPWQNHTHRRTYTLTLAHTHTHKHTYTPILTHAYTLTPPYTPPHTLTLTHIHTLTLTHIHTHTYTYSHTHTYTPTLTHAYTLMPPHTHTHTL